MKLKKYIWLKNLSIDKYVNIIKILIYLKIIYEFTVYIIDVRKNYEMIARMVNGEVFGCLGNLLGKEIWNIRKVTDWK